MDLGCWLPVAVLADPLWQQLVQQQAAEPKKQPKEEPGTCKLRHVGQMMDFCLTLGWIWPTTNTGNSWCHLLAIALGDWVTREAWLPPMRESRYDWVPHFLGLSYGEWSHYWISFFIITLTWGSYECRGLEEGERERSITNSPRNRVSKFNLSFFKWFFFFLPLICWNAK